MRPILPSLSPLGVVPGRQIIVDVATAELRDTSATTQGVVDASVGADLRRRFSPHPTDTVEFPRDGY